MLNIEKIAGNIVKELLLIKEVEVKKFEHSIKKSFKSVKDNNILFIGSNGVKCSQFYPYATEDIGIYEDSKDINYIEIKITGENNEVYPVISIYFSVKDELYTIQDAKTTLPTSSWK